MALKTLSVRRAFGASQEERLKPILEKLIGEPILKTQRRFDIFDFDSQHYHIELKSRSNLYKPESFKTWVLPTCKGKEAEKSNKKTTFFYYWIATDELYRLDFDKQRFDTYEKAIPVWHPDNQEHYFIPKEEFSLICESC